MSIFVCAQVVLTRCYTTGDVVRDAIPAEDVWMIRVRNTLTFQIKGKLEHTRNLLRFASLPAGMQPFTRRSLPLPPLVVAEDKLRTVWDFTAPVRRRGAAHGFAHDRYTRSLRHPMPPPNTQTQLREVAVGIVVAGVENFGLEAGGQVLAEEAPMPVAMQEGGAGLGYKRRCAAV
jgi:hypothetical protein